VTGALTGSFLVAASGTAWAAGSNWFVNPTTGSDSNACATAALPCKTITHALALSSDGDTITLAGGTYTGALTITKAVTIQGAGQGVSIIDAAETTPSASSASAMLVSLPTADPNTLTVNGVTIQRGISKFGGGIELLTGKMVVNNSTITNNEAGGITGSAGGGGIGVIGTALGTTQQLTLNGDTISHNKTVAFGTTNFNGGGLYLAGPTTMTNTVISANSTGGTTFGGGIFLAKAVATDTATLNATDTQVTGNAAAVGGGIANYSGGQLALTGDGVTPSSVSSNTGTDGAGIYDAGTATIVGTSISSNISAFEGGGFYESQVAAADTPLITATNDTLSGNTAALVGGGGFSAANSTFAMNGGTLGSNKAFDGGGLYIVGGATASFVGATVSNNVASSGSTANAGLGGGIFDAGSLSITGNSTLSGNQAVADTAGGSTATGWGGAVFEGPAAAGNAPTFTLANSTVSGGALASGTNAAVGGGIAVTGNVLGTVAPGFAASAATFTGTADTFSGLTAIDGAGAYVGGTGSFTGSTFSGDTASGSTLALGGGLLVGKAAAGDIPAATIDSTAFTSDIGVLGGGVAVNSSSTLTTQNGTTFSQDQATNSGGGLYMAGTDTSHDTSFTSDTAAGFGGAVFDGSVVAADHPVFTGTNVTMNGNSTPLDGGAATVATNASLSLTGGSIDNNTSVAGGGLLISGGATSSITGADISGNTANGSDGGAIFNSGALTISNSEITGNKAIPSASNPTTTGLAGGIYSGTSTASTATTLVLNGDTLSGNSANAASALLTLSSGSGDTNGSSITNSTITGNSSGPSFGVIAAFDPVTIVSSTINGNTSPAGASGGLYVEVAGAISVSGSDISGNSFDNCSSPVIDGGYNGINAGDSSCGFTAAKHDVLANPQLGALGVNGGTTLTEVPAATSPLINQIPLNTTTSVNDAVTGSPVVLCGSGSTDQRGSPRPEGATCDIGSVEVGVSAPALTGPSAATFVVGTAGTPQVFTSTGTPTAHLTESGAALPTGVTFTDNGDGTATVSGTPAAGTTGTYAITITANNGTAPNGTLPFTLTVDQAPAISGPASDTFTVNHAGSDSFVATGVPIPAVSESGALPSGVTFTDNGSGTGTLAGTPAVGTQGTYPLTITAHNGEGPDATLTFTLTVLPPVTITTTSLPGGTVGVAYSATLAATNGSAPYTWSIASGSLPAGLSLASGGAITGRPTGPSGTTSFVVKVTDSASPTGTATQPLSIAIAKGTTSLAVNPVLIGFGSSGLTITFGSVSATLAGGVPSKGIAGQTVTFKTGSTTVCSGVTTSTGAVRCNITVLDEVAAILANGVTATYAGSDSWLPSSGSAGLL
jgi:predicted outer membrane repeat protein